MDLLGYYRMLRRRWVLILVATVVGGVLGAASALLTESHSSHASRTYYRGTNTLVLDPVTGGNGAFQSAFGNLDQIAILTTTGDVPGAVAKKLGIDPQGITDHIVTMANSGTNTLEIAAVEPTADEAVAVADTFADGLIAGLAQRDTDRYNAQRTYLSNRIDNLNNTVNGLKAQLAGDPGNQVIAAQLNAAANELGLAYSDFGNLTATGPPTSRLSVLEQAQAVPIGEDEYRSRLQLGALGQNHLDAGSSSDQPVISTATSSSSLSGPLPRGVLGVLLGFFAGVGLVILLERLHRRVRTHEDAEEAFGLPVLAEVPRFARSGHYDIVAATSPMSRAAESYRAVRSSLLFARAAMIAERAQMGRRREDDKGFGTSGREQPFVIMVASASPDEGKSTTTANLAAVFAEMGAKVLVVNCDFRRPAIHRYFGVPDHPRRVLDVEIPGVKLITNVLADPSANPSQVVAAQRQVVASSRARFDFILLDTAPLLAANDAVEIVGSADLVLLVARSEETRVDSARRVSELLQRLDAPLAGVVLTGVPGASDDASYYYYQGGPTAAPGAATPPLATGPSGER